MKNEMVLGFEGHERAVFDCSKGMEMGLVNGRFRLDVMGIAPPEVLVVYLNIIVHAAYALRQSLPMMAKEVLRHLLVFEEAAVLLQRNARGRISPWQEILLRSRAVGQGFVFVTQNLDQIDPIVLSSVSNLFIFAQSSSRDKYIAQQILDLSREESELLGELPKGRCYVRLLGHPEFPYPFLAKVPYDEA